MSTHRPHLCGQRLINPVPLAAIAVLCTALGLMGGCTARSSGENPFGPLVEVPAGSFVVQWQRSLPTDSEPVSQLFLSEDKVFACTRDNQCYWINRASGFTTAVTAVASPSERLFRPVTLSDRVVFPSTSRLHVFDRQGKLMRGPGETTFVRLRYAASSPAVADRNTVFLGVDHENGGWLTAIDATLQPYDISPPWELMTRGQLSATPAIYNRIIFAGSRDGGVYAVTADDRQPIWNNLDRGVFQTGGEILADVKADHDGVYVASADDKLYCLDPASGRVIWTYYAGHRLMGESSPVLTSDSVYVYVPHVGVVAIDRRGKSDKSEAPASAPPAGTQPAGTQPAAMASASSMTYSEIRSHRWAVADARQFLSADDHYVYLRGDDNRILAADKQTGQIKFRSRHNDFALFAPNEGGKDATIYAITNEGVVCAIRPAVAPGGVGELVLAE